jgi:2,4-dienoyl-CoA reductase-like NADH-dependent reductase (Old Yellow Enzyme family)
VSKLFSPITLRGTTFENRIVVSPMCQYSATNGTANDWHVVNLGSYALSGPGLTIFEATHVSPEGRITDRCLGLYSDENEAGMKRVVEYLRTWTKTKIGVQLAHAGRKGSTLPPWEGNGALPPERAYQTVAPSAIAFGDYAVPHALDEAGLEKIRNDFVSAAKRCLRLGIDVIELHFAHGYLAHEFLSPLSNKRTDAYGGPLENRLRFPLELFDAVRAVWPDDNVLGVRISASDWVEGGWDLEQSIAFVKELQKRGCDFVDTSSGGLSPDQKIVLGPGYQVHFSEGIKAATGMTTFAVGMITEPVQAEEIVASGKADFIAIARGFIRNPRWVWDAADELGAHSFVPNEYLRGRATKA